MSKHNYNKQPKKPQLQQYTSSIRQSWRRTLQQQKGKLQYCSFCERKTHHTSRNCPFRVKQIAPEESKEDRIKRLATRELWYQMNPPENGHYSCYLQISPECPRKLVGSEMELDHVLPASRFPEHKYSIANLMPSCAYCNVMKADSTLKFLAKKYPHLQAYLE